jgi:hypothetical protein
MFVDEEIVGGGLHIHHHLVILLARMMEKLERGTK